MTVHVHRDFWIRINANITVGYGSVVGTDEFMRWQVPAEKQHTVHAAAFATAFGQQGDFSLLKQYGTYDPSMTLRVDIKIRSCTHTFSWWVLDQ